MFLSLCLVFPLSPSLLFLSLPSLQKPWVTRGQVAISIYVDLHVLLNVETLVDGLGLAFVPLLCCVSWGRFDYISV